MHTRNSIFEQLSKHSGPSLETRAENAFSVSAKFLELLKKEAPDEKSYDLMMKAWMRAIKDGDYSKFKRVYKKYSSD